MKEIIIIIVLSAVIIISGVIVLVSTSSNKYETQCELKGGVVVYSYSARNCWKDGQYIKAE